LHSNAERFFIAKKEGECMNIKLDRYGGVELSRTSPVVRGQNNSKKVYVYWEEGESPVDLLIIEEGSMLVEINITRPDGEQSGWMPCVKVNGEMRWYYTLCAWDTSISGTAFVSVRWYDSNDDAGDGTTTIYSSTICSFVIDNGVIAQPLPVSNDNYSDLMALITPLQTYGIRVYKANFLPADIVFNVDGKKERPALYTDFLHKVTDLVVTGASYVEEVNSRSGVLLVAYDNRGNNHETPVQIEVFFATNGNIYFRKFPGETLSDPNDFYKFMPINAQNIISEVSVRAALALKQDTLTFDNTPTNGSTNPVTSEGVYNAIQNSEGAVSSVNSQTGVVVITKSDVGLGNVTNDAQIKRIEMGSAGGVATLGTDSKIPLSQLPDVILGQLVYGGALYTSDAMAFLSTNAKTKLGINSSVIILTNDTSPITGYGANEGIFYIALDDGNFAGLGLKTGDWLLSTGNQWQKVDNTDAVVSVNGSIGAVTLYGANLPYASSADTNTIYTVIEGIKAEIVDVDSILDGIQSELGLFGLNFVYSHSFSSTLGHEVYSIEIGRNTVEDMSSTSVTETLVENTRYNFAELTDLDITFPTGNDGDTIVINFVSGSTPTTLIRDTTNAIYNFSSISADVFVELNAEFKACIQKWVVISAETPIS